MSEIRLIFSVLIIVFCMISVFGRKRTLVLVKSFPDPRSEYVDNFFAHPYDLVVYRNQFAEIYQKRRK